MGMGAQMLIQGETVLTTIVWTAVATAFSIYVAKAVTGLRVTPDVEREGLDLGEHGERAYNY
jgi:Amt family ammonium transporter